MKFFKLPINSGAVKKFMSVGNKNLAKPNFADNFAANLLKPGKINPAAANKTWPMK